MLIVKKIKLNNLNKIYEKRLQDSIFYKIDFGLNRIKEKVYFLTFIASLSDISAIDITFDLDLIGTVKKSIKNAYIKSNEKNSFYCKNMLLFVSLENHEFSGLDIHKLIPKLDILNKEDIDVLELHIDYYDIDCIEKQLNIVHENFQKDIISLNLSRKKLSNANIIEVIKIASSIMRNKFFIEVDGITCKVKNSYNNTLQSISTADIINKELKYKNQKYKNIPLLLAGGTNSLTKNLANQCNVPFNGITINENYFSGLNQFLNIFEEKDEILYESVKALKKSFMLKE